jgi:uncharacterized protein DUF4255/IPT/TIG domain-containing protein
MSYLAIGSVTKAIAELLEKKLNKPPLLGSNVSIQVTTLPPDDERVERDNGVNLFLFRVAENAFAKNMDWPGDRVQPGAKRPPISLTLHYLLTAYAKKSADAIRDDVTAHQILGNALQILHENPVLNDIHDSDFDADLDTQLSPELRNAFDKLKLSFSPISLEEFSKIWTGLSKAYRLSVAYEVSMVQIAPMRPAPMPGPPVQRVNVGVATLTPPVIIAIDPVRGPAGMDITIRGSGFRQPGRTTSVTVGEARFSEAELSRVSNQEIALKLPTAMQHGPDQPIVVTAGGLESAPASYRVDPWISSIEPLRGITGIPLTIPLQLPAGAFVSAEFDGQPVTATPAADRKSVGLITPNVATNGLKPIALIVNDGGTRRSNERFFEVLPAIQSVNVTVGGDPVNTTIAISGQRLKGQNVQVRYAGILVNKGENTSSSDVAVQVARSLPEDQRATVIVDGRESAAWPPQIERIEPSESKVGSQVTVFGSGLSGQSVIVRFATTPVALGAAAYSTRLAVRVPAGLAPGVVQVRAVINGTESNAVDFEVRP